MAEPNEQLLRDLVALQEMKADKARLEDMITQLQAVIAKTMDAEGTPKVRLNDGWSASMSAATRYDVRIDMKHAHPTLYATLCAEPRPSSPKVREAVERGIFSGSMEQYLVRRTDKPSIRFNKEEGEK